MVILRVAASWPGCFTLANLLLPQAVWSSGRCLCPYQGMELDYLQGPSQLRLFQDSVVFQMLHKSCSLELCKVTVPTEAVVLELLTDESTWK